MSEQRELEPVAFPSQRQHLLDTAAQLGAVDSEAREMTSERLSRIFSPIEEELQRCQEIFVEVLTTHHGIRFPLSGNTDDGLRRPETKEGASFPLVTEMAGQLRRMEGKWIRAGLVLLSAKAFECASDDAIRTASALELIHLATLVHDDIIDLAETRRGCRSLPSTHGQAASVLMGDFLYAKAMGLLIHIDHSTLMRTVIAAVEEVCLGEISEHQFSWNSPPSEEDYMGIIRRKTARLMECCTRSGCLLSTGDGQWADQFGEFGLNLGMAFQITDDILDITADGCSLGKDPGIDLRNENITLPVIHLGIRQGYTALQELAASGGGAKRRLVRLLKEAGSLDYARAAAQGYASRAEQCLEPVEKALSDSRELESLKRLARLVVERGY